VTQRKTRGGIGLYNSADGKARGIGGQSVFQRVCGKETNTWACFTNEVGNEMLPVNRTAVVQVPAAFKPTAIRLP
jgi:hypothetical protein